MTAVENVNLSVRHVPAIGFRQGAAECRRSPNFAIALDACRL